MICLLLSSKEISYAVYQWGLLKPSDKKVLSSFIKSNVSFKDRYWNLK